MSGITERWWRPEESGGNALLILAINRAGGPRRLLEQHEELVRERAARLAAETGRETALAALRLAMRALSNANGLVVAIALTRRFCVVCTEHPRTPDGRSSTGAGS